MSETLYYTKFLELKSTPSKNGGNWVYAHRPNAKDVVIILATTEEEILFLIEERPPIQAEDRGKYTIGLVAGLVGDERIGESIEDAVKAELLEEAGLIADKIEIKANKVASSAGCVSETCTIALAHINNKETIQKPIDDNGIIIDRVWIKKSKVHEWLREKESQGYVLTAQALASLFYLYE
ncbi:MAG: hypothetical protein E7Z92_07450 [Cyanobacteria bacterium SIG31]|nr:hypothetical protein [Cyanobacteria bacterium SIG31]